MRKLNHSELVPRALVVISMQATTDALAETAWLPHFPYWVVEPDLCSNCAPRIIVL